MSNEPDLPDEECRDCGGSGMDTWFCSSDVCDNVYCEFYGDCVTCSGSGRVQRGPRL